MKRLFLFSIMLGCFSLASFAQDASAKVGKVYNDRIQVREVVTPRFKLRDKVDADSWMKPFYHCENPEKERFGAEKWNPAPVRDGWSERLDSVLYFNAQGSAGNPVEKHAFQYDEQGRPLHRSCYSISGSEWGLYGEDDFEYDELGRVVRQSSLTFGAGYTDGYKYEYLYEGSNTSCSEANYYCLSGGEWVIAQKAVYTYDAQGNTTSQALYYSDDGVNLVGFEKETATYNAMGLMDTYYPYDWDFSLNDWVGSAIKHGQNFYYRADGQDDWIETFVWENGQWSNYCREFYSYDDHDLLSRIEYDYWNREHQDWLGGDVFGPNGFVEYNSIYEYVRDDMGRATSEVNSVCERDAEYVVNYMLTRDFTDLDNGHVINEEKEYGWINSNELELYSHDTYETNAYDFEVHYLHRYYMDDAHGVRNMHEMVRDYDDATGRYNWTYFYAYTLDAANIRYGLNYETCLYDEDGNISHYHHMKGTDAYYTDTVWYEDDDYAFSYMYDAYGNPVKVSTEATRYENGNWVPFYGFSGRYDFSVDVEDCLLWPLEDLSENFSYYKTLEEYNYSIYDGYVYETTEALYYSKYDPTSVSEIDAEKPQPVGKLRYYDVLGRRVNADAHGLIIVRDAEGNVYKLNK